VEFALPASGMLGEIPSAAQPLPTIQPSPATERDKPPFEMSNKGRKKIMHEPLNEDQKAAAGSLWPANDLDGAKLEDNALFHQFEDMTAAAATAARNYRSWMLEHMKINMCAALDYANGLASVNACRLGGPLGYVRTGENTHSQSADQTIPTVATAADEYRAKAFELMTANINATFEYAQRLVNVNTPSEFVELSTSHARKQFELIMKQTAELGSIAQKLAAPNVQAMTAGLTKALGGHKE
jgi:hypothetical protein